MTPADWEAIAKKCEKAKGPDRGLDMAIAEAIDGKPLRTGPLDNVSWFLPGRITPVALPRWSGSIDAITSLIAETLPGKDFLVRTDKKRGALDNIYPDNIDLLYVKDTHYAYAATPALALCAAFCRARAMAAKEKE